MAYKEDMNSKPGFPMKLARSRSQRVLQVEAIHGLKYSINNFL